MLTVQDELTLLARARQLDPEALAHIHDTYYTSIFRYVAFRVGDHATAEDLTSEVFTRLLTALRDKGAPQNTLRGWLYGVAARVVIPVDRHRRHIRARGEVVTDREFLGESERRQRILMGALHADQVFRVQLEPPVGCTENVNSPVANQTAAEIVVSAPVPRHVETAALRSDVNQGVFGGQ